MKRTISIILIFVSLLFIIPEKKQQIYVKHIYMDKTDNHYQMQVISYDFSSQEEAFISSVYRSENIFTLAGNMMKNGNYNLRLCENCIVSRNVIEDINQVVYVFNSMKIPPSANLICITDKFDYNIFIDNRDNNSPVYNLKVTDGKVTGFVSVIDITGKNMGVLMFHQGIPVKKLNKKHSDILYALINRIKTFDYTFRQGQLCAKIDVIDCFYSTQDNNLTVNLNCILNTLSGINNYTQNKTVYTDILKTELENDVYQIITDPVITSVYKTADCFQCENIKININMI